MQNIFAQNGKRIPICTTIIITIIIIDIRSDGKPSNPKAQERCCKEATQSGPLTHSQSRQAQNTLEHAEVKHRRAWTKEEI